MHHLQLFLMHCPWRGTCITKPVIWVPQLSQIKCQSVYTLHNNRLKEVQPIRASSEEVKVFSLVQPLRVCMVTPWADSWLTTHQWEMLSRSALSSELCAASWKTEEMKKWSRGTGKLRGQELERNCVKAHILFFILMSHPHCCLNNTHTTILWGSRPTPWSCFKKNSTKNHLAYHSWNLISNVIFLWMIYSPVLLQNLHNAVLQC